MEYEKTKRELALELHSIGAIRFGEFILESGIKSPVYLNLRLLASRPESLKKVAGVLCGMARKIKHDRIVGIPYAAFPLATALSLECGKPLVCLRKDGKGHGGMGGVEWEFTKGEVALVVDDLVTTAQGKLEAIDALEKAGLVVKDLLVVVDREQGGREQLEAKGYRLHAALSLKELIQLLLEAGSITEEQARTVRLHVAENTATKRTFTFI